MILLSSAYEFSSSALKLIAFLIPFWSFKACACKVHGHGPVFSVPKSVNRRDVFRTLGWRFLEKYRTNEVRIQRCTKSFLLRNFLAKASKSAVSCSLLTIPKNNINGKLHFWCRYRHSVKQKKSFKINGISNLVMF